MNWSSLSINPSVGWTLAACHLFCLLPASLLRYWLLNDDSLFFINTLLQTCEWRLWIWIPSWYVLLTFSCFNMRISDMSKLTQIWHWILNWGQVSVESTPGTSVVINAWCSRQKCPTSATHKQIAWTWLVGIPSSAVYLYIHHHIFPC